jgi:uncharacterized OB-fold protein
MLGPVDDRAPGPLAGNLVTSEHPPRLIAARCATCATVTFPSRDTCPSCTSDAVEPELLGPRGTLWTWTVQRFPPKPPFLAPGDPESFQPFGVGYVEFPGQLRVEARLTEADPERLRIGMPMEVTVIPVPGHEHLTTYAFAPVAEG